MSLFHNVKPTHRSIKKVSSRDRKSSLSYMLFKKNKHSVLFVMMWKVWGLRYRERFLLELEQWACTRVDRWKFSLTTWLAVPPFRSYRSINHNVNRKGIFVVPNQKFVDPSFSILKKKRIVARFCEKWGDPDTVLTDLTNEKEREKVRFRKHFESDRISERTKREYCEKM